MKPICVRISNDTGWCVEVLANEEDGKITSNLNRHIGVRRSMQRATVVDAIESLILGHAVAGVDITQPSYIAGLQTAIEALSQR